ncbi:Uncharacterised protein [Mycolicibacterium phlei]|jgi:hypothetical protein|uniref:Large secreted protein n=1 Tax=Mycolicibacterium phlei DSM 43239 = CCUG 21000 TaxID=1226750 RepID=A0A5N5UY04_MYCPH|nr:hypothetical protein [Mycolicibacterium phlei]VEG07109.1 Uncharacterised protein [Mycobacteroides chelonae]AMO58977.1 hypothetical protein MPHLCCUG_00131 [Mycolicibacterium phlei]KAB7754494.1 hypothetical protein MPHL21000_15195 [Mycolicibacterium phlei DSM 43239 = CCUG 21000]KXW65140.1 hypothetical protein MPHL43239_11015 [Mycolicibacterium phlei DSM 43239 = CCUG 21000]KXW75620.1 hypothetical protein JL15_21385 [Mycolicibacterium phlei DSM 43071]
MSRVPTAAVLLTAALWTAPTAVAETAVLPEQPGDGRALFTDNPAIVDAHPLRAESFNRLPDDRAIAVHFTTGTPQCYGVHATATETPETVTVALTSGALPEAAGRACIEIAVFGAVEVALAEPLGDRVVLTEF